MDIVGDERRIPHTLTGVLGKTLLELDGSETRSAASLTLFRR